MKALVTGAGALLGQGIIRALTWSALDAEIVAVDPNPLSAGLYWGSARYLVPMAHSPEYLDVIGAVLRREKPDVVLIGTDVELMLFAGQRAALEAEYHTHIIVSSPQVIAIADDKWLTYRFLKDNGFDYPRSCLPGDEAQLIAEVGFPLIVKPRVGARSVGVHKVYDAEELQRVLSPDAIIQECVATDSDEYTAGALVFGDTINTVVMRRDLRDGNTYRAFVDAYPALNEQVRALAQTLRPYGPANFQFRLTPDGRVKVFEINGRFSGTTPLRVRAGFNEVEMAIRYVLEGRELVQPAIKPLVILRHWSETIVEPPIVGQVTLPPEDRW
jgi:carbamoyl-phosphate synthase large subunit